MKKMFLYLSMLFGSGICCASETSLGFAHYLRSIPGTSFKLHCYYSGKIPYTIAEHPATEFDQVQTRYMLILNKVIGLIRPKTVRQLWNQGTKYDSIDDAVDAVEKARLTNPFFYQRIFWRQELRAFKESGDQK